MALQGQSAAFLMALYAMMMSFFGGIFPDNDPNSLIALVNKDYRLTQSFSPELILPDIRAAEGKEDAIWLRAEAAAAAERLFADADAAGVTLYGVSGYRSYTTQQNLFQRKKDMVGEKAALLVVAPAGASEHQLGLALDINGESTLSTGLTEDFGASPEGDWVRQNAHRYGFIIRYPRDKTDITGYAWEPWHLRYLGTETAEALAASGQTLEEYYRDVQAAHLAAWAGTEETE